MRKLIILLIPLMLFAAVTAHARKREEMPPMKERLHGTTWIYFDIEGIKKGYYDFYLNYVMIAFNFLPEEEFVVIKGVGGNVHSLDIDYTRSETDMMHIRASNKKGEPREFLLILYDNYLVIAHNRVKYKFYKYRDLKELLRNIDSAQDDS